MHEVRFYKPGDRWGAFSNFAPWPIEVDGLTWPTVEHWFQAQKFVGTEWVEAVRTVARPADAARIGRRRDLPLRADWDEAKDEVMRRGLEAKFTQHPELVGLLLGTGTARLVEDTEQDAYWGDGADGRGRNRLGELLMEVRAALVDGSLEVSRSRGRPA